MRKIIFLLYILSLCQSSHGQSGTLDASFADHGVILTSPSTTGNVYASNAKQCFIEADGKITMVIQSAKTGLTRRLPNGSVDVSYAHNGYSDVVSMSVITAAKQANGKIIVAGTTNGSSDFMLARYNTDGTVDASFGDKGVVISDIGSSNDYLNAIAIAADDKIIAGGSVYVNGISQFTIVRYSPDGTIDPSFGSNGVTTTNFDNIPSSLTSLTLQPDGKIVATGITIPNDGGDFALARYNADGSPDLSFNTTGRVTDNFGFYDWGRSVVIDNDAKIYVGGISTDVSGFTHFRIARYDADGSHDLSFNGSGSIFVEFANSQDNLSNLALQTDGKIIAAGRTDMNGAGDDIELIRVNVDGSIDNTFGNNGNGLVTADVNSQYDENNYLVIKPDGKIVAGGNNYLNGQSTFTCFRFNTDGTPDPDFGTGGSISDFFPFGYYGYGAMFSQADGKLLAIGSTNIGTDTKTFINRFDHNGNIDDSYGQNGSTEINTNLSYFFQPDGKLLGLGYSQTNNGDILLVRYNSDGTPDGGFGNGGSVITDFGGNESVWNAAFQPDGKIIVGGVVRDNNGSDFLLARYNPDGSVDASFGNNGYFKLNFYNEDQVQSISVAPDGKIVFGGSSIFIPQDFSFPKFDVFIGRLKADGSVDEGFGNQGKLVIDRSDFDFMGFLQVQNDNKILFTYYSSPNGGTEKTFMEHLNEDGSADSNFGQGGNIIIDGALFFLQNDQKIIVLGRKFNNQNNTDITLARFTADGNPDLSFGSNGKTTSSFTGLDNYLYNGLLSGNDLFGSGNSIDSRGISVGIIAKYKLEDASGVTCPSDQVVNTDNDLCTAKVYNIDPTVTPAGVTVNYTLTGATTGTGTGSVSGKLFNKGVTTVTCTLNNDATKTCSFTVTVQDKQVPVINNLNVSPTTLWPPDHKLKDIIVNYSATDNCGIANTQISVSSDEPVQDKSSPHWQIVDDHHIRLRAELFGNERTYSIKITATDLSGNQSTATATVKVLRSIEQGLVVTASPNPSHNYFLVKVYSNSKDKINFRLLDNSGTVLKTINNMTVLQTVRIGENLTPGIYFAEVSQSGVTKTIKLIKQ
jgi:uncharacterized delta-60 repeat protein